MFVLRLNEESVTALRFLYSFFFYYFITSSGFLKFILVKRWGSVIYILESLLRRSPPLPMSQFLAWLSTIFYPLFFFLEILWLVGGLSSPQWLPNFSFLKYIVYNYINHQKFLAEISMYNLFSWELLQKYSNRSMLPGLDLLFSRL